MEPGQELTHYVIAEKIGEGGMGEVWLAKDTRLDRDVAIKILPTAFVDDEERLTRFEREAKALAKLNHPYIAQIFGVDQVEDVCFLVLELVPGETLAERIAGGPLSVEEALNLCRQIAEGLEAAHDAGIVHRDLKPANVRITPGGVVKVLDFGLAKSSAKDPETGETLPLQSDSLHLTSEGRVLGTPTYMSPEQARGKRTDRRTDIWAFGCVLFEALSGQRVFTGETVTDVMGAIVHKEPDWELLPERTPTRVRELLRRCLSKDAHNRLRDIGDARVELEEILADPTATMAVDPVAEAGPVRKGRMALWVLLVALITAGATWAVMTSLRAEETVRRFRIATPDLQMRRGVPFAISPDGRRLLHAGSRSLWIRDLDTLQSRPLADTDDATHPFWSPDSRSIGFVVDTKLWRMSADGGSRAAITSLPVRLSNAGGATWLADGTIVWGTGREGEALLAVSAGGGDPKTFLEVSAERGEHDFHQPTALPGSKGVVFVLHRVDIGSADTLAVLPAGATEIRRLLQLESGDAITSVCYAPSGHILYSRSGSNSGLWALPFSLDELVATGEPFLAEPQGYFPSAANDGTLVHSDRAASSEFQLEWLDRDGLVTSELGDRLSGDVFGLSVSPDGRLGSVTSAVEDTYNVWIFDVERGSRTRIMLEQVGRAFIDAWMPSSDEVLMTKGLFPDVEMLQIAVDGSGLSRSIAIGDIAEAVTPDGSKVIVERLRDADNFFVLSLDGSGEETTFLDGPADKDDLSLSPDGRYAAYNSVESGRDEVYVTRFPSAQGKWLLYEGDADDPLWSAAGDEIFFMSYGKLMSAPISTEGSVSIGPAVELFDASELGIRLGRGYGVSPDGQRILVVRNMSTGTSNEGVVLVENWAAEFADR